HRPHVPPQGLTTPKRSMSRRQTLLASGAVLLVAGGISGVALGLAKAGLSVGTPAAQPGSPFTGDQVSLSVPVTGGTPPYSYVTSCDGGAAGSLSCTFGTAGADTLTPNLTHSATPPTTGTAPLSTP